MAGALALALVVVTCGDAGRVGGDGSPSLPPAPSLPAARSPSPSGDGPAASPGATARPFDPAAVAIDLEVVGRVEGNAVGIANAGDGTARLFVLEQDGRIWIFDDGRRLDEPFLDIRDQVLSGGERGLLGLAFHPGYPDDPRFFVYYTDRDGNQRLASAEVSEDPARADPDSLQSILRMEDFAGNHNGGALAFGPDGYLYVATGDGGGGGDPRGSGQSLVTFLGKILRLDVDRTGGSRRYAIPAGNPLVDRNAALPEIWAWGLRNPWRTSFDPVTGDFWIGDVGQGRFEEIDVIRAGTSGQNFGWNVTEGFTCYPGGEPCSPDGLVPPVTAYSHDLGCAVVGGKVYRGTAIPALVGGYLFADYCSGLVWAIDAAASHVQDPAIVLESGRSITAIGAAGDGELYATDISGELLQVIGR